MRNLKGQFNKRAERRAAIENSVVEAKAVEILSANRKAVSFKLDNASATLTPQSLEILLEEGKLNLKEVENILRINAIVGYVCGSEVGKNTKAADLAKSITCGEDVLKIFKNVKVENKGTGVRYVDDNGDSQVFQEGVNIIHAATLMGNKNVIFKISYHELNKFLEILSNVDYTALNDEDIKMIKRDIDLIGRALQEIAIDSAKDKSKADGWAKMGDFIDLQVKMLMDIESTHNFEEIKRAKYLSERDGVGSIPEFKMDVDCVVPKNAYSVEAFNALSVEEQRAAEDSPVVCGNLGLAKMAVMEAGNEEINKLVDAYRATGSDDYGLYASIGKLDMNTTVFINRCLDALSHAFVEGTRLTDNTIFELRDAIYNEIKGNPEFGKLPQSQTIKLAIAAAMAQVTENKKGESSVEFKKESLRFGTVTRLFKDEFLAEYKGGVEYDNSTLNVLLPTFKSSVELVEGNWYKFLAGVCTNMFDVATNDSVVVESVLEAKEPFTGVAVAKDGKLYAEHEVSKVMNDNIGCLVIKEWLDLEDEDCKAIDATKLYSKDALDQHVDLLYNADALFITGKDSDLIIAQVGDEFKPVCRVRYNAGLVKADANKNRHAVLHVETLIKNISVANEENKHSKSRVTGVITYTVK